MSRSKVPQIGPYPSWDQEPLDAACTMHHLFEAADKAALLQTQGAGIMAIATRGELGASRDLIEACPGPEIISVYGVGYDAVNLETARARNIVNASVIEAIGSEGMLINISLASNIDEEVLLGALETGKLGSAALDVFEGEPKLNPRFLKLENVLLQPHHASGTLETRKAMGMFLRDSLAAHFDGNPLLTPVP